MSLQSAIELQRSGRFREAFEVIERGRFAPGDHIAQEVLKAELLQVLGRLSEARDHAWFLLKNPTECLRQTAARAKQYSGA